MKKEAILDPWIIQKIKEEEEERRRRREKDRPRIELPDELPQQEPDKDKKDGDRGVVIINFSDKKE